jgi:NAD(P)-dependent dehydrogenase (short-subunit alcohol dehydrogenase family)
MTQHGGGAIINTASAAGIHGGAAGAAYTAAKHAVVGLTRNTAWMYAAKGIRCNAICPGATKTHIGETMPTERLDAAGAQRAQAFTALAPADIAALALFLASDEARHINGAIIPADAGWAAV